MKYVYVLWEPLGMISIHSSMEKAYDSVENMWVGPTLTLDEVREDNEWTVSVTSDHQAWNGASIIYNIIRTEVDP